MLRRHLRTRISKRCFICSTMSLYRRIGQEISARKAETVEPMATVRRVRLGWRTDDLAGKFRSGNGVFLARAGDTAGGARAIGRHVCRPRPPLDDAARPRG